MYVVNTGTTYCL